MTKRMELGCLAAALVSLGGAAAAVRYDLFCLFVPCDRALAFRIETAEPLPAEGCELWLFGEKPSTDTLPVRKAEIEGSEASITIGPWIHEYWASLHCKGREPSAAQPIHFENSDETVPVRFQR